MPVPVAVLVEGPSDVAAVRTLLGRTTGAPTSGVDLVAMGGATNLGHALDGLGHVSTPVDGPGLVLGEGVRVLGLCDAAEASLTARQLQRRGVPVADGSDLPRFGFHVCTADLEEELIRAVGVEDVLALLEDLGLTVRFERFRAQPAWQGRDTAAQLRRFAGSASGRKELLAGALAAAVPVPPPPLAALLADIRTVAELVTHAHPSG